MFVAVFFLLFYLFFFWLSFLSLFWGGGEGLSVYICSFVVSERKAIWSTTFQI